MCILVNLLTKSMVNSFRCQKFWGVSECVCVHVLGRKAVRWLGALQPFQHRHGSFLALAIFSLDKKCGFKLWPCLFLLDGSFSSGGNYRPLERNQAFSHCSDLIRFCSSIILIKPNERAHSYRLKVSVIWLAQVNYLSITETIVGYLRTVGDIQIFHIWLCNSWY